MARLRASLGHLALVGGAASVQAEGDASVLVVLPGEGDAGAEQDLGSL